MSTKAAVEALAAALKRREDRFDVQFLGIVVGTATDWVACEADDGTVLILYYNFKRSDIEPQMNIAVDFERGEYYTFTENDEFYDIDYDRTMSIVTAILGKV